MNLTNLQNLAREKEFRCIGQYAYGKIGRFPVMLRLNNGNRGTILQTAWNITEADYKKIKNDLKADFRSKISCNVNMQMDVRCAVTVRWHGHDTLIISLGTNPMNRVSYKFDVVANMILRIMDRHQINPPDTCPICGQKFCDSLAHEGYCYRPVHRACLTRKNMESAGRAKSALGWKIFGVLGAILGGILGCIPSFLNIRSYLEIPFAFYVFIPIGIYLGYRIFRGKPSPFAAAVLVSASIVFALGLDFYFITECMRAADAPLSFLPEWMKYTVMENGFFRGLMDEIFCLVLGIILPWHIIATSGQAVPLEPEAALQTVVPIESFEEQDEYQVFR